jgi:hypothetical protein
MNPNEQPKMSDPNFQQNDQRAIHRAYGQRTPETLTNNPSHQPHECCGRIFPDKVAFNAHFASIHQPFLTGKDGKQIENPEYLAPGKAEVAPIHAGLPLAEHRVGGLSQQGHSTGLAATEKRIPVPNSGNPLTGAEQVGPAAADNLSEMSKTERKEVLADMKKPELQNLAEKLDVPVSGSANKAELASAINRKINKESAA